MKLLHVSITAPSLLLVLCGCVVGHGDYINYKNSIVGTKRAG